MFQEFFVGLSYLTATTRSKFFEEVGIIKYTHIRQKERERGGRGEVNRDKETGNLVYKSKSDIPFNLHQFKSHVKNT